ncbi:MAG: SDR family oxidoreductase [Candidatus Acidiferrum sp.]|jgi:NAD(P)-dependent dehydrogenase (short-subunit alcohol dehydrogenase family)
MATVLITGASRGIGLELARQYAADGWRVLATARNPRGSAGLGELAEKHGGNLETHRLDVADENSVGTLAALLKDQPIDLLINNAGTYPRKGTHVGELDYQSWRDTFETNLFGVMHLTEALLKNVARSGRKQIAAISSGMGSLGAAAQGSVDTMGASYQYRTSKSALNMALLVLSKELAPRGISVAIISPGWVKTDMGGAQAAITPQASVAGIRKVLDLPGMEISGKFLSYDGSVWAW